jgi:hypothetical protein
MGDGRGAKVDGLSWSMGRVSWSMVSCVVMIGHDDRSADLQVGWRLRVLTIDH